MVLKLLPEPAAPGRLDSRRVTGVTGVNGAVRCGLIVSGSGLERTAAGAGDGARVCCAGPESVTTFREDMLLGEERGDPDSGGLGENELPELGNEPGRELTAGCVARGWTLAGLEGAGAVLCVAGAKAEALPPLRFSARARALDPSGPPAVAGNCGR